MPPCRFVARPGWTSPLRGVKRTASSGPDAPSGLKGSVDGQAARHALRSPERSPACGLARERVQEGDEFLCGVALKIDPLRGVIRVQI